jgi:hypothetical protein
MGSYCVSGAWSGMHVCAPRERFSNVTGGVSLTDCWVCSTGFFCAAGSTSPTQFNLTSVPPIRLFCAGVSATAVQPIVRVHSH